WTRSGSRRAGVHERKTAGARQGFRPHACARTRLHAYLPASSPPGRMALRPSPASGIFDLSRPAWRRRLLFVGLGLLAGWLAFFDSHSLVRRVTYAHRLHVLQEENARLRAENEVLQERLAAGLSPALVERVAREQYGMRRPGETVYRVTEGE